MVPDTTVVCMLTAYGNISSPYPTVAYRRRQLGGTPSLQKTCTASAAL